MSARQLSKVRLPSRVPSAKLWTKIFHVGHGNHEDQASWSVAHFAEKSIAYVKSG